MYSHCFIFTSQRYDICCGPVHLSVTSQCAIKTATQDYANNAVW